MKTSGNWNYTLLTIIKGVIHQEKIGENIKFKFGNIIDCLSEFLTPLVYKYEDYDLLTYTK